MKEATLILSQNHRIQDAIEYFKEVLGTDVFELTIIDPFNTRTIQSGIAMYEARRLRHKNLVKYIARTNYNP